MAILTRSGKSIFIDYLCMKGHKLIQPFYVVPLQLIKKPTYGELIDLLEEVEHESPNDDNLSLKCNILRFMLATQEDFMRL